jgi:hypothetical protein
MARRQNCAQNVKKKEPVLTGSADVGLRTDACAMSAASRVSGSVRRRRAERLTREVNRGSS